MPIINQVVAGSGGSAPQYYLEKTVDANGVLVNTPRVIDLTGVTGIGDSVLYGAYKGVNFPANTTISLSPVTLVNGSDACREMIRLSTNVTTADLSTVTTIDGSYAFADFAQNNTSITSVDLGGLTTVTGGYACYYAFNNCQYITNINLSSLTTVGGGSLGNCFSYAFSNVKISSLDLSSLIQVTGYGAFSSAFSNCRLLTSVDMSSLTTLSGNYSCQTMFSGCVNLTNVNLSSLTSMNSQNAMAYMFMNCTGLTSLSFPSLTPTSFGSYTNQFSDMLKNVTGCTVHFPSNIQSTIGSWTDVTNGFSGTNTTVLFDLPATVTLTGADTVTYTRNPKYDTPTALAWKVGAYGTTNFTPAYYTSGTTDPSVSDAIYSDAACTTSVTTISSIA